ncbi:MAG: hypothetical protein EBW61_01535 [Rhodobacteraceae bacterium]|nr:hypothetical protein [Paracoccaceae bacterium]
MIIKLTIFHEYREYFVPDWPVVADLQFKKISKLVGFFDCDVKMVALTNWYHHFELIKVELILWDDPQI